ncbi:MAG: hypothetical protein MRZ61_02925 [Oscillospiraceae bacterium]|nr:hypothetical protein [Oscillospiraceae bacterium]
MLKVIYDMSADTKIREIARLREKALHDEASALKNAKAEGLEEGMVKGRAEGKTEERNLTIRKMKELGFTDEQIKAVYPDLV